MRGIDYKDAIDIAACFRSWNRKHRNWNYFSLRHEAYGLLGMTMSNDVHDPTDDAKMSMLLFTTWIRPGTACALAAAEKLQNMRYRHQFPDFLNRVGGIHIDGVCGACFRPSDCICGQPSGSSKRRVSDDGVFNGGNNLPTLLRSLSVLQFSSP